MTLNGPFDSMMRRWLRSACRAALRATRSGIVLRPGGVSTKTVVRANLDFGLAFHSTRNRPRLATVGNGSMVAFSARSWKAVDDFYAAALANGGSCDGAPGLRLHYGPDFYAAFVRDLDGNKLAAVCRGFTKRQ